MTSKEAFILLRFFGRIGCSWTEEISLAEEEVEKKRLKSVRRDIKRVCFID